jgi:N-acetylneuraminic acid mutarotase
MMPNSLETVAIGLGMLALVACRDTTTEPNVTRDAQLAAGLSVAADRWIARADLPSTERWGSGTAVVTNAAGQSVLYIIGGKTISGGSLSKVQAYNVATNTWSYKASLPQPLYWPNQPATINGKIYVSGGYRRSGDFRPELYMYDPVANRWTRKRDMPFPTYAGVSGVTNNRLYVLTCGHRHCNIPGGPLQLYRYNPGTDTWAILAEPGDLVTFGGVAGVIAGKLYVSGSNMDLAAYDPRTNQWTAKANMPSTRIGARGASVAGKLYVIGGQQGTGDGWEFVPTTSVYDPSTDTWSTKAPMPVTSGAFYSDAPGVKVFVNGLPRIELVGGWRPGNNVQYIP